MLVTVFRTRFPRVRVRPPGRGVLDALTVGVLLGGLLLPGVGFFTREAKLPPGENRPLSPPPALVAKKWAVRTFPPMFDAYFRDRAGFRPEMLAARQEILADGLGELATQTGWRGDDGWLFINTVGLHGGFPERQPPVEPNLDAWAEVLADRHAFLAARGVKYVAFVARDKSSVYPEHLAGPQRRHPPPDLVPGLQSRLRGTGVSVIDPLPELLAAKDGERVFYQKDSHWNDAGALAGYRTLGAWLGANVPGYRITPRAAFTPAPAVRGECDLARTLGFPPDRWAEPTTRYNQPGVAHEILDPGPPPADDPGALVHIPPMAYACPTAAGPPTVLLHDSFGYDLVYRLRTDVKTLHTAGTYGLPVAFLDRTKPAVVVQLFAERFLRLHAPKNPPGVAGFRAANPPRP